jgi:tape measure domain-containing protein
VAYRAEIEIAVRGATQITNLQKQIELLSAGVDRLNGRLKSGTVNSIENFKKAVSQSERVMRSAAQGTDIQKRAIDVYVKSVAAAEKAEKSLQVAIQSRRRELGLAASASAGPVRGGRGGGGRLGGVVSNAVIGGSFPLLFGQGGGAATGGALGGALGGLLGGTGGFAGSLLGTLLGSIAEQGGKIKELAADIGLSADQTTRLQQAFKLAGQDADKFTEAVQNIRGVGLAIEDQAKAIDLVSVLTEKYGGNITKVTNALTGALESGKVTQATLNQLSSQGIDIQGALAERYNTNRDAILKMAKDGTISVQDLIDTLVVLGNKGVKSAETTQSAFTEGFARIQQATERLQQVLVSSFDETGKSIQFSLGGAIQAVTRYVEEFILGLAELSRVAGVALDPIISGYVRIQSAIYDAVTAVPALRDAIVAFAASAFGPLSGVVALIDRIRGAGADRKNKLQGPPVPARLQVPVLRSFAAPAQALPSGAGGAGAKPKKDKTAEELQRSLEQGRALSQEFARQVKLLNTTTDIERKRLQIQFDFEDRQKQISELKNAEQRTSLTTQNQEIRRLELIDLQTEALKKQTDEAEKLFDVIIQGYNFGVSREGGTGAGIFGKLSELKQNLDPVKVQVDSIATGATVIGDAFSLAFGEIISGAKSTEQALADTFQQIGDAFINMAVNIIAQQMTMIILGSILKALGIGFNLSGTNALSTGSSPLGGIGGSLGGAGYGGVSGITPIGPSFGGATFPAFLADGGFVTGPTSAVVGEGGESEYIIPASKMRSAMSRYAAGARGSAVIPAGDDTSSGGGTATMAPAAIDVRYTVERINSVDYVTADQFRAGMAQAAQQGATQGEQRTLRRLQQSRATRSRLGMN